MGEGPHPYRSRYDAYPRVARTNARPGPACRSGAAPSAFMPDSRAVTISNDGSRCVAQGPTSPSPGLTVTRGFVIQCDKNDYRGVLLGLEGVTGKAVDSDVMTVKN
jgi:hypothetical protein